MQTKTSACKTRQVAYVDHDDSQFILEDMASVGRGEDSIYSMYYEEGQYKLYFMTGSL